MEEKEFIEMRQQLNLLREKLNDQEIINHQLLRESMRNKTSDIKQTERLSYIATLVCLLAFPIVARMGIISYLFAIVTCLMVLVCAISTVVIHRPVNRTDLMTADLATVASILHKFKRQYEIWLRYITPALIIPWTVWLCFDIVSHNNLLHINPIGLIIPMLIGLAIGGFIGYRYDRRAVSAADNILDQLKN